MIAERRQSFDTSYEQSWCNVVKNTLIRRSDLDNMSYVTSLFQSVVAIILYQLGEKGKFEKGIQQDHLMIEKLRP